MMESSAVARAAAVRGESLLCERVRRLVGFLVCFHLVAALTARGDGGCFRGAGAEGVGAALFEEAWLSISSSPRRYYLLCCLHCGGRSHRHRRSPGSADEC